MEQPPLPPPGQQQEASVGSPNLVSPAPAPPKISLSFKNGEIKTLERFLTARTRFETPDAERAELYRVFRQFDNDGDGKLSVEEIRASLEKLGVIVSAADLASIFRPKRDGAALSGTGRAKDANGHAGPILSVEDAHREHIGSVKECEHTGYVDFPEFYDLYRSLCQDENEVGVACTPNGKLLDSELRSAFDLFDKNHDNFISVTELQSVLLSLGLKEAKSIDECKSMIASVDSDRDGMVNFSEFKAMMRSFKEAP